MKGTEGHVIESRIEKVRRFISSPLNRRKSACSSMDNVKMDHKIFGTPIELITQSESIPFVIKRLCEYIEDSKGFMQEGLFRTSGNAKLIEKLKYHFDSTGDAPLETEGDIPSAAALLKLFLRELPVPLIPHNVHSSFLSIVQRAINQDPLEDNGKVIKKLKVLVECLPNENYFILKYLSHFLHRVALHENYNRMTPSSLGIIFGPNIFRVAYEDYKGLREQSLTNQVVTLFITGYEIIFADESETLSPFTSLSPLTVEDDKDIDDKMLNVGSKVSDLEINRDRLFTLRKRKDLKSINLSAFSISDIRSSSEERKSYKGSFCDIRKCSSFEDVSSRNKVEFKATKSSTFLPISTRIKTSNTTQTTKCKNIEITRSDDSNNNWRSQNAFSNEQSESESSEEKLSDFLDNSSLLEDNFSISDKLSGIEEQEKLPAFDLSSLHKNADGSSGILSSWITPVTNDDNDEWDAKNKDDKNELTVENAALSIIKRHRSSEAPLSPSAYRSFLGQRNAHLDSKMPPSPPVEQEKEHFRIKTGMNQENIEINEMKKKVHILKKRLKSLENDFERENGYRPSHEQKMKSAVIKPVLTELNKLRKDIKDIREEARLEKIAGLHEEVLFEMQRNLRERRFNVGRPELIEDMNTDQIFDEKLDLQKSLLKYESLFGRPTNKEDRAIMKPIYDRYRTVKKIVSKMPKVNKEASDLQPILENVAMNFSSPSHSPKSSLVSDEITQENISTPTMEKISTQIKDSVKLTNPSNYNLHELPFSELVKQLQDVWAEKQNLRKVIRCFEEDFLRKNGRKPDKTEKLQIESVYINYKDSKGKLRLLEALIAKYEKSRLNI